MQAGRIAAGSSRASRLDPFSCPCVSRPPMKRPTSAAGHRALSRARRCSPIGTPACAWRSICRSRHFVASPFGAERKRIRHADRDRRRAGARRSGIIFAAILFQCLRRYRGRVAVLGPCAWPAASRRRARRQFARAFRAAWARCASKRQLGGAAEAAPLRRRPKICCGAGRAWAQIRRAFIAASVKSSPGTDVARPSAARLIIPVSTDSRHLLCRDMANLDDISN